MLNNCLGKGAQDWECEGSILLNTLLQRGEVMVLSAHSLYPT